MACSCAGLSATAVLLLLSNAVFTFAQNQVPTSDPQALSYANQAFQALLQGNPVSDVTINGNVVWIPSTETETGTGTLSGKGLSESRFDTAQIVRGGSVRSSP